MLQKSEYQKCKISLVWAYKLVAHDPCTDVAKQKEEGDWMSDDFIVAVSGHLHPAELLRFLRLMTSIRMAWKASWKMWCILYAAKGANRAWATEVHEDIRWLVSCSPLFSEIDATSLAAWLTMAKKPS